MDVLSFPAPFSKSVSHRMMIGAALASGESFLSSILESRDLERTRAVLGVAGAVFEPLGPGAWRVEGVGGAEHAAIRGAAPGEEPRVCDVGESGTTCRLLTAVLAAGEGKFRIDGAGRMRERPIGELTTALACLGAGFRFEGRGGYPPFVLEARGLDGGEITIGLEESSQYLSGLLLAAPLAHGAVTIEISGRGMVSWPYVGLTLQTLKDFGAHFDVSTRTDPSAPWRPVNWRTLKTARPGLVRFRVRPSGYRAGTHAAEGDWSGASYLLAAGALGPKPVRVTGLRHDSLQGDRVILDILSAMGAEVESGPDGVITRPSRLRAVEANMASCPDLVPTVAVLAAAARGDTVIKGVAHLRLKESDRIAAPAAELRKAGVDVDERDDGLVIHGQPGLDFSGRVLDLHSWGDHRMAMSLALLGCKGAVVKLDDPAVVAKSFPQFWELWGELAR